MESIRSFSFAKRIVVLFVLSFLVAMPVVGFVSSSAKASSTQDIMPIFNEKLYAQLTAHQHYFYLASCFRNNDIGKMGASDVDGWDFFNNDDRYDAAIGAMYGGDGSMDCKNGDNVSRAAGAVGTTLKAREAFCKMKNAKYGGEDVDTDAAYRVCVSGSTPDAQWDDDGSDNLVKQYESFRDNMGFKDPGLEGAAQYMRAYSTLINGCNLKAEETVYDSWDKAVEGAKGESEIMPFVTMEKKGKNIVLQYRTGIGSRGDSSVILVATTGLYEPARGGAHGGVSAAKYPRTMRTCDQLAADTNTYAEAYKTYVNLNGYTEGGNPEGGGGGDPKSSCSIEGGLGWILCPVMTTLATINDTAFKSLDGFLEVNSSTFSNSSLKSAWESFRDLANIAFIGAFLVVVYSQITGAGITNYGIKKLLPKIIIAAILVNISFWICALAVDISNVLGASLKSLFEGLVGGGGSGAPPETWSNIVGGLLTAVIGVALIIALILAPTVLLAVAVVLIILIARQAFVILLIVLSPLAFVAYLLPNTNAWFKKWWKAFSATLMVYPIVGAIFGASTLASNILAKADGTEMKLAALAVLGIPLFAVPVVLKGAMNAAGTIGAKLAGLQDRANRFSGNKLKDRVGKEFGDLKNRATERMLNSNSRRARAASFLTGTRRRARREARYKDNEALRAAAEEGYVHQEGSRTAERKARVAEAQETSRARTQLVTNQGKQASLQGEEALHRQVAGSNFGTHHMEETVKNRGEEDHLNDPTNQQHYNELVQSREDRKSAEVRAGTRAKQTEEVRQSIRDRKRDEGAEKTVDLEIDREFADSDEGRRVKVSVERAERQLKGAELSNDAIVKELTAADKDAAGNPVDKDGNAITVEGLTQDEVRTYADDLRVADIETRVQTQRGSVADGEAVLNYQEAIRASDRGETVEGFAGRNLVVEAGGIGGEAARQRAVATAVQISDKQMAETIGAQKTTLESIAGDTLVAEYQTGFIEGDPAKGPSSPERLAAVAGTIASRGYMGGKLELLRSIAPALASARADAAARGVPADRIDEDPAVLSVRYAQKQLAADMKEWPFGVGDRAREQLALGTWEGDIDADFQERIETKLTGAKLTELKPEEVRYLASIAGSLTPDQRASLDKAVHEAQTSDTVRKDMKPETWTALESMGFGYTRP